MNWAWMAEVFSSSLRQNNLKKTIAHENKWLSVYLHEI